MVKVSIIVPVYNVEKYIEKCLYSLVNQTLKDIEIIVVNDGSTDESELIINKYKEQYRQIKYVVKKNGGLSDARNYGLSYALGEYIGYVDSDDYVELNMYEKLYKKAKDTSADIVECNLFHDYHNNMDSEIGDKIYNRDKMIMVGRSVVWNKIYNRKWLLKAGIKFPKGCIYEDVEFYVKLVPHINKIEYIDDVCIHYVQRSTSINYGSTLKTMDILTVLENIKKYYVEIGEFEKYKSALEFLYTRIILCSSLGRISRISNKKDCKYALRESWRYLNNTFPNWNKNPYLKELKGKKSFYMRHMNYALYSIIGFLFPLYYKINKKSILNS